MQAGQENPTPTIVNIARSARAAGVSVIHALNDRRSVDVITTHQCRLKARCADSESRFLAIKKFSC
jgi:DNA segregation ATPase FtsK/SpoIIIE-like protein